MFGDSSSDPSRDPSPDPAEPVTLIPTSHIKKLKKKRSKKHQGLIFTLGGLFGLVAAAVFADRNDVISLDGLVNINLDSLFDVIPAGIIRDAKEISVC